MAKTAEQYFDTVVAPHLKDSLFKSDFISLATELINATYYQQFTNYAIALLSAHNMALAGLDTAAGRSAGQVGAVSTIKESELQVSYYIGAAAQKNGMINPLAQTGYGMQLLHLQRMANLGITATGMVDNLSGTPVTGLAGGIIF